MTSQMSPSLGVLSLESCGQEALPPELPGSMMNPATYGIPIISETVVGAWAEVVIAGDATLEPACIAAARRLVERGAAAITSNCGFFIRHQPAVAAAVNVPVAMSSLLLIPTLLRQLPRAAKLAVLTADSTCCSDDLLGLDDPAQRSRIVIAGIEGTKYWHDAMLRPLPPIDVPAIERDVAACVARLRAQHPEIAAILFECTAFPLVAKSIRDMTELPVYDITSLCLLVIPPIA